MGLDETMEWLHRMGLLMMFVQNMENENVEGRTNTLQIEHSAEGHPLDWGMYSHHCYLELRNRGHLFSRKKDFNKYLYLKIEVDHYDLLKLVIAMWLIAVVVVVVLMA